MYFREKIRFGLISENIKITDVLIMEMSGLIGSHSTLHNKGNNYEISTCCVMI